MSRAMRLIMIPGALLALAGCTEKKAPDTGAAMDTTMAATPPAAPATQAPPADLRSRSDAFAAAWNQDAPATVAAFFANDAVVHYGDSTYTGRADISNRWIAPGLPGLSDLKISDQAFTGSGDTMTENGSFSETITMPKQKPATNSGTYTVTWTKMGADWMVKEMTVHPAAPAPAGS